MKYCASCGTELAEGAMFCPKCGIAVSIGQEEVKASPNLQDLKLVLISKSKDFANTQDFALDKSTLHKVSIWIAIACGLTVIIWLSVIGFYPSDLPKIIGIAALGVFFVFVHDRTKGKETSVASAGNPEVSKWKCTCGTYNNGDITNCINCGKQKSS